jgi:signal transduction histidine kinase
MDSPIDLPELARSAAALDVDAALARLDRAVAQEGVPLAQVAPLVDGLLQRRARESERYLRLRHELKNPLVAIKGYVDMMLRGMVGPFAEPARRYLRRIAVAVERQRAVIDDQLRAPERP